jgi:hypothetical protein
LKLPTQSSVAQHTTLTPAAADEVRILSSRGGEVGQFIDMFVNRYV